MEKVVSLRAARESGKHDGRRWLMWNRASGRWMARVYSQGRDAWVTLPAAVGRRQARTARIVASAVRLSGPSLEALRARRQRTEIEEREARQLALGVVDLQLARMRRGA